MDFGRVRLIAQILVVVAGLCIVGGLIGYSKGFVAPGVILMIAGVSVGMICVSVLRLISLVYNPWLVTHKKSKKSHHRWRCIRCFYGGSAEPPRNLSTCSCRRAGAS